MTDSVRLLCVHGADDPSVPGADALARADDRLVVETARSVEGALDRLATNPFDCVLSAYRLPDEDGLTLLRHLRDLDPVLPFVLCVRDGTERIAADAVAAGATDYLRAVDVDAAAVAARAVDAARDRPDDTESRVRELTEATDDVLWLISADWERVLFLNSAYARVWGQPEATLRDDPTAFLDAVHPEDRSRARAAMDRLADGESVEIELRVDPSEAFERRVLVRADPVFDRTGSVARVAGVSREVTEQRVRQRRLEEEKRMTDSIFAALPDVLYTFDTSGYLLRWNDRLEAVTGYSADEIEEMYVTDFVPDDEVETIADRFWEVIDERRQVTVESAFETKAGERVPFEFTGAPLAGGDGDLRGVTGVGRDLSERHERQRRFEAVFDNTYQFTGLMSPDGTVLEANRTAVEFTGQRREDLVGEKIWETSLFRTNETAREAARRAVETARAGELFREQITVQGGDREAVVDFSVRPVTDEDGETELLVPEGRDITRLMERERQLEVTNRFLRHNIRNELTTIQGYAELVSEAGDDRLRGYGAAIRDAATALGDTAETARDIQELIRRDPTPGTVDLAAQVDRAAAAVRERRPDADVTVDAPAPAAVKGLDSLHRGLVELLTLVLDGAVDGAPTARLEVLSAGDDPVLEVRTNGGLPEVERTVLLGDAEVDQTRHAQGLGVWYAYWQVRYSGATVTTADDGTVRVRFQPAGA